MRRALFFFLVTIFTSTLASAQSFDYADRPEYKDENHSDTSLGEVEGSVSSYEDSVREIPERTVRHSYASETLAFDVGSLLTVPAGFAAPGLWLLGAGSYILGAPLVHLAHFRPLTALASLGLRIAAPPLFALGLSGGNVDDCHGDEEWGCGPRNEFVIGFALGMGAAMAVDAALLANEEVAVEPPRSSFTPWVNVTHAGATAGVGGAF